MNKKFITICLIIISLLVLTTAFFYGFPQDIQPICYGEEQISFPAPSFELLNSKSSVALLFSSATPYFLGSAFALCFLYFIFKHRKTMKKHFSKLLCVALCALCIGTSVSFSISLADTTFSPVSPSDYYGRKQLETMENSGALLYAYDQMAEGIESHASEISVRNIFHSVNKEEWLVVLYSYLYDYPQHFWMDSSYRYSYQNGSDGEITMIKILPNYVFSASELASAREAFHTEAQEILNKLSPSMDEYQLAFLIHNELCNRITYNDSEYAHSAYGGLVTGVAVCEGYGKAYQYLLNQVGIESTLATGVGRPAGSSTPENHAWNFNKINGKYYFTDVTWDDQNEPYYGYFNITTAMLNKDHKLANYPYEFPECTALDDNYFTLNNAFVSSYNREQIVNLLQHNLRAHVYLTGSASTFTTNLFNDSKAIMANLNMVSSSNINISSLGSERLIIINGHRRGDVNKDNILDELDIAILNQYLSNSSTITDASCLKAADYNNDGKIDTADIQGLSTFVTGEPFVPSSSLPSNSSTAPSPSSATTSSISSNPSENSSTISSPPPESSSILPSHTSSSPSNSPTPSETTSTVEYTLGDINEDNIINAKDALTVLKISVGKETPTEKGKLIADVNKDGNINAKDALEILKKAVGKPACF